MALVDTSHLPQLDHRAGGRWHTAERCPRCHQWLALIKELRSQVGSANLLGDDVRQCRFADFITHSGDLGGPDLKARPEAVHGGAIGEAHLTQHLGQRHVAERCSSFRAWEQQIGWLRREHASQRL